MANKALQPSMRAGYARLGQIGVGIVGGGFMAAVHSRAARAAGASLRAVVASSPASGARAAEELGVARSYPSVDAMLADDAIDIVHVCTPNALHAEQAAAIIAAGRHIVCEKPLATTVIDAARIATAADTAGLVAAVPFVYRFHPMVREARARIAAGDLGSLLTVRGRYLQDWMLGAGDDNWRADRATAGPSRAFADIGSHLVDLIEFVTGDRVARLAAAAGSFFPPVRRSATEDAVGLVLETMTGALGTLLVSQVAAGRKNALALEVSGTKTSLEFDAESPETLWIGGKESSRIVWRDPSMLRDDARRLCRVPAGHPQGYQDAFNGFVADVYTAIATGTAPEGLPTFQDGRRAAAVTQAVLSAVEAGRWVDVPEPVKGR